MRKLIPIFLITCVAFIGLALAPPLSETGKNTVAVIQGFVYDSATNVGLENVLVSAADISVSTDTNGFYSLIIEPGNYDILYIKEGWFTHIIPSLAVVDTLNIDVVLQHSHVDFPFTEDWSSGDFETNGWTFEPTIGNWLINTDAGNPAPSAEFNFSPLVSNYSYALISPQIDARSITENLMLNFDIYLFNSYSTGTEKLRVDIWNGSEWCEIKEFTNANHIPWTMNAIDITQYAAGKFTKVRLVAHGQNTINIENWRIDNIRFDLAPAIAVNMDNICVELIPNGPIVTIPLNIFNIGSGILNFEIVIEMLDKFTTGVSFTNSGIELSYDPNPVPGAGTTTSPGELLHEQFFNPMAQSWNTINLDSDVILDGTDLWVGCQVTHASGVFSAGVDAGPANPNGDWISIDGIVWKHLAGYGLNQNFNIRAKIHSTEPLWLSVDPVSGSIEAGNSNIVDVIFNPSNLGIAAYHAYLKIYSNDPLHPLVTIPVTYDVFIVPIIDIIRHNDWAKLYPLPANDNLHIDFSFAVKDFRIINQMGQIVLSRQAEGKEAFIVDVSHLPNGLYFLQADAKDGKVYSRKIVISR
jgi:hypothetical protein